MRYLILLIILMGCGSGDPGAPGQSIQGPRGYNSLIGIINSAPNCPAEGITIVSGIDINYDNQISSVDENIQTATVCNGVDGQNGQDGKDGISPAYSPVSTIASCWNTVAYKEQILCLANGQLLASFSDNISGYNTRLAFLSPGSSYLNTDGSNCLFSVTLVASGTLVSWSGGSQLCEKH